MQSACAVLYCHLWHIWLYHIFPHYLTNGTISVKCYWTWNVLWFSVQLLYETFLTLGRIQRDIIIIVHMSSRKVINPFSWQILMELEFSRQIFEKNSNMKFHQNPSCGSRIVPCWQTDGRTDVTKVIVAFRNFRNAPKNHCKTFKPRENKYTYWAVYDVEREWTPGVLLFCSDTFYQSANTEETHVSRLSPQAIPYDRSLSWQRQIFGLYVQPSTNTSLRNPAIHCYYNHTVRN
jgi:hypothetical protein